MNRKDRYAFVVDYFRQRQPDVTTELLFDSPFQLLVATMLSAQCTDKRINMVTPSLFQRYPDAATMASATEADIFAYIKSVSYPNAKAKHLVTMAKQLVDDFDGVVPDNIKQLTSLSGVGRKTANVVLSVAFQQPTMAVDTHVYRVSHRLALVPKTANTPEKVEHELVKNIPEQYISRAHHWLLLHGRYTCTSRNPKCTNCDFSTICPSSTKASSTKSSSTNTSTSKSNNEKG
ncbi:MAG: endonuclease III [Prevotella sp.]|nr:endonuclease III [Prevotella sp.]